MPALHLQGPPVSTVADALALIVGHYAATASRGAWTIATPYAVDDTVSADGRLYRCFAAGTSDSGSGPAGMGSQSDSNGVGWTPVVYVGERYVRQHGAPPSVLLLVGDGKVTGPSRNGAGYTAGLSEEIRAYLWATEALDDIARYAAIEAMIDALVNIARKTMPGRHDIAIVNPITAANIVTFGELRQVWITYRRDVPRDAAIYAVPVDAPPTLDAMRPNGDLGTAYTTNPTTNGSR